MDIEYTTLDPLSDWQDLTQLLNEHDPLSKAPNRLPRQPDVLNGARPKIIEQPAELFCCHGDLSTSFDSPWSPFLYAIARGKILHKPSLALERLGPLMRRTDFIIRVESPLIAVFFVQTLDEYGCLNFVEIDRQVRWGSTEELPEWLQGAFARDAGTELEWKCKNHGKSFRCTALLRKAVGLSWW